VLRRQHDAEKALIHELTLHMQHTDHDLQQRQQQQKQLIVSNET
jgi:hypothetical protein